jgi:hypothetical protein
MARGATGAALLGLAAACARFLPGHFFARVGLAYGHARDALLRGRQAPLERERGLLQAVRVVAGGRQAAARARRGLLQRGHAVAQLHRLQRLPRSVPA